MGAKLSDVPLQPTSVTWLLPFSLIVLTASYVLYQRTFHPFAAIPGPFWASLTRLWITKHAWNGDMNVTMIALHKEHGSLVRTGPWEVSVSDPAAIKRIYGAGTKFRKSDWYSVWQGHRKFDLFAERNEKLHGEQRRLISRAYSMEALRDLEPYVDKAVEVFLENMNKREGEVIGRSFVHKLFLRPCRTDNGIPETGMIHMLSFEQIWAIGSNCSHSVRKLLRDIEVVAIITGSDVIGEVSFSKRFGFMDASKDDGSFKQIEGALRSASWIGQVPTLYWIHDRLMPYIGNHLGITARHGSLRQFAMREVAARKDRGTDHNDILSKLFTTQKERPLEMDENAVTSMATSNIFAGSDTTAISTRAIIYYLLKNPEAKRKFLEEIADRRRQGKLSDIAKLAEADDMPYLQAVMYEALRLHPAVGMSLPRVVPEGGFEVAGQFLPAGSTIGANPWVIHQDKEVYGDDVDAFRPERWLKEDNGDMHRFFFAFGSGARMCLGRNISWMEMSKLIPTLFMHYNLELSDPEAEWRTTCWWFVNQQGVNIKLTRRHS